MPEQKKKSSQPVRPSREDVREQARVTALDPATQFSGTRRRNATRKARCTMDPRQHKGLEIAALSKINRKGNTYLVPSQSGNGQYKVKLGPDECACPDFQTNHAKCKHLYAVEYMLQRESNKAVPLPEGVVPLRAKNYTQNW